ncbi:MAG: polysaccharide biosynthesis protein [Acidiferrobacterales bacterium]|nr:polysaccharide biosynthesis protein [Acidiferrobacterales bacterium]
MIDRLLSLKRGRKQVLMLAGDLALVMVALCAAYSLRYNRFYLPFGDEIYLWILAPILAIPVFIRFGLYQTIIRYIGFNSLWRVFQAISLYALLWGVLAFLSGIQITPRSVVIINWLVCLLLISGARMVARWVLTAKAPGFLGAERDERKNVLIYGAGAAGMQLAISTSYSDEMRPVGFVDDDPVLMNQQVNGIRVYHPDELGRLIDEFAIKEILLAMPSANQASRQKILLSLAHFPVLVQTLPDISELESCEVNLEDVRDIDIADLLEREPIAPIDELLQANIRDKVVMVTGAGGSIGSELCRQVSQLGARRLILFEHSEFNLYRMERELSETNLRFTSVLGSVMDRELLTTVCHEHKVETIYHAAAYKHVPLVESNASAGAANNVLGTCNCARAAIDAGVETFVLISTDKAVRPTNVMGATKRLAELVLQDLSHNAKTQTRFTMVRFGNVLDSSGSVVPLFRDQISQGGPVTVTHPEIIRYFMTIREATQLVLQAGAMGEGGDVFVLDMGEPVKIVGLARKMIQLSGLTVREERNPEGDIEIAFTGLRAGEKLFEELLVTESAVSTRHQRIMRENEIGVTLGGLDEMLRKLEIAIAERNESEVRQLLFSMVESYNAMPAQKAG